MTHRRSPRLAASLQALSLIDGAMVLAFHPASAQPVQPAPAPPLVAVAPQPLPSPPQPPPPPITKALLPGHWQLSGANWVWVPPERHPRPVEQRPLVPGTYVWRDGAWRWVPAHFGGG